MDFINFSVKDLVDILLVAYLLYQVSLQHSEHLWVLYGWNVIWFCQSCTVLCGGHLLLGSPGDASGKEPTCQCSRHKRCGFDPWVRKIPEKGMATHSSILSWRIPWTEEPGQLTVHGVTKSWMWLSMQEGDQNVNQNGVISQMLKDDARENGPVTGTSESYKTLKTKEGEPWWFLRVNLEMVAAQDGEDAEKLEANSCMFLKCSPRAGGATEHVCSHCAYYDGMRGRQPHREIACFCKKWWIRIAESPSVWEAKVSSGDLWVVEFRELITLLWFTYSF